MKFGFEKVKQSGQERIAELFDIRPSKGQSDKQFRQEIVSTIDYYKNIQQKEKQLKKNEIKIDREKAIYSVIGYDEPLINSMKSRGLSTKQLPINTERSAKELLKFFTMQMIPLTFVDTQGNIWQLKN
jgi:hypothetical protein